MTIIRTLRKDLDMTQKSMAEALGVSQGALSRFEHGTLDPSVETARRIVAFAADRGQPLTLDQLYGMENIVACA